MEVDNISNDSTLFILLSFRGVDIFLSLWKNLSPWRCIPLRYRNPISYNFLKCFLQFWMLYFHTFKFLDVNSSRSVSKIVRGIMVSIHKNCNLKFTGNFKWFPRETPSSISRHFIIWRYNFRVFTWMTFDAHNMILSFANIS